MSFTKKQYFIKFLCLNWSVIVLMIALVATARTNAFLYTSYFFVFWTVYVLFTLKSGEQKKFTPKKYLVTFLGSNLAYLGGGLSVIAGELNLFPNVNFYDFYAGAIVLMGTFAYRSKKERLLGFVKSNTGMIVLEYLIIFWLVLSYIVLIDLINVKLMLKVDNIVILFSFLPYFLIRSKAEVNCPFCACKMQEGAKKCGHCGEFLNRHALTQSSEEMDKWYFRKPFITISLCSVGPFALPLIWWRPKTALAWKIGLSILVYLLSILFVFLILGLSQSTVGSFPAFKGQ